MRHLLFATAFALAAQPALAGEPLVVRNFDRPMWDDTHRIELTETLRIGGDDDDSEIFGQMVSIAVNARGEIITADYNQNVVRRYDADGKLIATVGRSGDGPGEYRYIMAVAVDSKDNIYVAGGHRVSIFDPAGKPIRDFRDVSDSGIHGMLALSDGTVILSEFDRQTKTVLQKYENGKHTQHFVAAFEPTGPHPNEVQSFAAGGFVDIGPDGSIYYSQMVPYEIQKLTPAGVPLMRILRENDFVTEPKIEKKGETVVYNAFSGSCGVFVLPDGRILNCVNIAGEGDTRVTILDLFDAEGHLLMSQRLGHVLGARCRDSAGNIYAYDRNELVVTRYAMTIH
jgi:hypothetical protein